MADDECIICLDTVNSKKMLLPCNCSFYIDENCWNTWIQDRNQRKYTCPICRNDDEILYISSESPEPLTRSTYVIPVSFGPIYLILFTIIMAGFFIVAVLFFVGKI